MHIFPELQLSENGGVLSPWCQDMHAFCSKISTWRASLLERSTATPKLSKCPYEIPSNLELYRCWKAWWGAKPFCAFAMQGALDREGDILGTCPLCDLPWQHSLWKNIRRYICMATKTDGGKRPLQWNSYRHSDVYNAFWFSQDTLGWYLVFNKIYANSVYVIEMPAFHQCASRNLILQ